MEQEGERVIVTARGGDTFSAPAAVVAVPLNTLGAIDFSPALSADAAAAVERGHAGHGIKLSAQVRGELEPFFLMAPDDHPVTFVESQRVLADGSHLLVAFGPDAERLDPGDEEATRRALAELLPEGVEVEAVAGHNWLQDPFSRGTWSVYRPGQLSGSLLALRERHGRVVLAGADFAQGWNGFIDGAIESGLSAARAAVGMLEEAVVAR